MRSSAIRMKAAQLNLFLAPQAGMRWESLPQQIQQQSVGLLAQLLREHATKLCRAEGKERGDE
jgi:hypothetical protein